MRKDDVDRLIKQRQVLAHPDLAKVGEVGVWGNETAKGEHIKCIVKDCLNNIGQGRFVGNLCSPCHNFLSTGNGVYSQAYRNTKCEWVGLTDEEYKIIHNKNYNYEELACAIEAKLKEKNT